MAYFTVKLFANSLNRFTTFDLIIPNDVRDETKNENTTAAKRPMKTLFLLHGYTGNASNWVPEYLAEKYNFAIVMPNGENSFWLDGISTGHKFCTFVGEELVTYIRKTFHLAASAVDTYIMGLSMGGFGALHTAFTYPQNFGKVTALSSALIIHEIKNLHQGDYHQVANYEYYRECFGELSKVATSDNNPEVLVKKLKDNNAFIPQIFMSCGTEDFLLENNREFHNFLNSIEVAHEYLESKGGHDMEFWNEYAIKFVEKMFG